MRIRRIDGMYKASGGDRVGSLNETVFSIKLNGWKMFDSIEYGDILFMEFQRNIWDIAYSRFNKRRKNVFFDHIRAHKDMLI